VNHIGETNKMVSDTPRTDKILFSVDVCDGEDVVNLWFARQLEHELTAANQVIRQQQLLDEENLRLQERIKRLEEAGDELLRDNDDIANINRWHKAKEAKP
jgi:hypothetical protein